SVSVVPTLRDELEKNKVIVKESNPGSKHNRFTLEATVCPAALVITIECLRPSEPRGGRSNDFD
ncbi:MAG: hypothetical protein O7C75_02390, partial [Verrucomicrobia bacterium]|nr:hypothetical protein [Verrucomicrobiota bacterium]